MSEPQTGGQTKELVFEYALDEPPEKVWRAISTPGLREKWLPEDDLADAEPVSASPGEEIRYRMREDEPPFLESTVTFQVRPDANGGSVLRVIHALTDARVIAPPAANSNGQLLMRAA
ncbi:SRPBCC family protein [Bauldia sp.]|uniref:SRPBCC family protein n=1 Tax=Bauldia sp. TaxID=2575872 RepID=UPI003BACBC97